MATKKDLRLAIPPRQCLNKLSAVFSLDYFGNRRTDTNVSSKFQGVETASQIRYVTYFERLKKMNVQYPVDVSVAIKTIEITGLCAILTYPNLT